MRFKGSKFSKWIARIICLPLHILALLLKLICFSLDSDGKVLLYLSLTCGKMSLKLIDLCESIYTFCGWNYWYRWLFK